jgi:hypothetical protein
VLPELLHGQETRVWGDQAYRGQRAVIRDHAPKARDFTNRRYCHTEFAYSYQNYYSKIAVLSLSDVAGCLRQYFLDRLNQLPPTVSADNLDPFSDFFQKFDIYYTKQIVLGGRLALYSAVSNNAPDVQDGHLGVHESVLQGAVLFGQR